MKPMFFAFAAIVVVAIGASIVLGKIGFSSEEQNAGAAVRLGDTGS